LKSAPFHAKQHSRQPTELPSGRRGRWGRLLIAELVRSSWGDYEIRAGGIEDRDLTAAIKLERDPADDLDHAIDDNERGLKDTIRVNPNELVEIAVRFNSYGGRYMYHCHILEHEDRDMMRPFVTMPPELMPFMA
jgi:FtsP/CotA-like multicopper oxidase with cupredoxin domain